MFQFLLPPILSQVELYVWADECCYIMNIHRVESCENGGHIDFLTDLNDTGVKVGDLNVEKLGSLAEV